MTYVFVPQRLQQEEEDGFKVLVPHSHAVFSCDLQQLHEGPFTLLRTLVVIGQLLQQIGHHVRVILTNCCPREDERNKLHSKWSCWHLVEVRQHPGTQTLNVLISQECNRYIHHTNIILKTFFFLKSVVPCEEDAGRPLPFYTSSC